MSDTREVKLDKNFVLDIKKYFQQIQQEKDEIQRNFSFLLEAEDALEFWDNYNPGFPRDSESAQAEEEAREHRGEW